MPTAEKWKSNAKKIVCGSSPAVNRGDEGEGGFLFFYFYAMMKENGATKVGQLSLYRVKGVEASGRFADRGAISGA